MQDATQTTTLATTLAKGLPSHVLFACTHNSIRSPMAAGIGHHLFGHLINFGSVGVRATEINPFAIAIMAEIDIDLTGHQARSFADIDDVPCNLIISLTPDAQHHAIELTRRGDCEAEFWPTYDPSLAHGNRDTILDSYREVRDALTDKITARFQQGLASDGEP
jgi:protein-tyrosine-phosphatase